MKKLILSILAFALVFSLASCKKNKQPAAEVPAPEEQIPQPEGPKYSEGLEFVSHEDGTCSVKGIGSCTDTDLLIPPTSPTGERVVGIENSAFAKVDSINSITIHAQITKIGDSAFKNCKSLSKVVFYENSLLTEIGEEAFMGCSGLTEFVFPEELVSIGDSAFENCHALTEVLIPGKVSVIGIKAFSNCLGLKKINVDENNSTYLSLNGVLYSDDGETLVQYPAKKSDKHFVMPEGVTTIGAYAFAYCDTLGEITISDDVTHIADYAFLGCDALVEVVIPGKVTTIGKSAFYSCTGLIRVEIAHNVSSIGNMAFGRCFVLTEIKVMVGNTRYRDIDGNLYSYDGKTLVQYAIGKKDKTFEIPSSVTKIGLYAFRECENIESITLASGSKLTTIDTGAFFSCKLLKSVEITAGLTKLGANAFNSAPIKNIYFGGTEEQWKKLNVADYDINNAKVHFNSDI